MTRALSWLEKVGWITVLVGACTPGTVSDSLADRDLFHEASMFIDGSSPTEPSDVQVSHTCSQQFGAARDFVLCRETATSCAFNVTLNSGTCAALCASYGSSCLNSYGNTADDLCSGVGGSNEGCSAAKQDQICECARATTTVDAAPNADAPVSPDSIAPQPDSGLDPDSGTVVPGFIKIFTGDFESGSLTGWNTSGNAASVVSSPAMGQYAARMLLDASSAVMERTELVPSGNQFHFQWGTEYIVEFKHRLEWSAADGEVVAQLHGPPHTDGTWASDCPTDQVPVGWKPYHFNNHVFLISEGGEFRLTMNGTGVQPPDKGSTFQLGSYATNVWISWKLQFKLSPASDGFFKAYRDGALIVSQSGKNVDETSQCNKPYEPRHYLKVGIYKDSGATSARILYYDDVAIYKK